VDSRTDGGKTPFIHAATWGKKDIMEELVERRHAIYSSETKDGDTAFHYAAWGGHDVSFDYCRKLKMNVNKLSKTSMNPMMTAAMMGQ
jgi:ankyrin repeat protein